jgi:hypothetical protein
MGEALVPIAMFGWIPAVLLLFTVLPRRRAIIAGLLGGWLFLPYASYGIEGFPDYTKDTAAPLAVLLGVLVFSAGRLLSFRPRLVDVPMAIWCLVPFASSVSNDLGMYDGLAGAFKNTLIWGVPYLIGRVYLRDLESLRDLALGFVLAALIYVPLCLFEMRMSPQLHRLVYGYHARVSLRQDALGLGLWWYRPNVFLVHGLNVAFFMGCATVLAVWLWWTGAARTLLRVPMSLVCTALGLTTLLCQVLGGVVVMALGLAMLPALRSLRTTLPLVALMLTAPLYIGLRASGDWSARELVHWVSTINPQRAASLEWRLDNEDALAATALRKPLFGWGSASGYRIRDEVTGRDISTTDGLWIIALGENGLVGLSALTAAILLPIFLLWRRQPWRHWTHATFAPAAALVVVIGLFLLNNLMNALVSPVFAAAIGGLTGLALSARRIPARRAARRVPVPHAREVPACSFDPLTVMR